jgi:hypothetical protein
MTKKALPATRTYRVLQSFDPQSNKLERHCTVKYFVNYDLHYKDESDVLPKTGLVAT